MIDKNKHKHKKTSNKNKENKSNHIKKKIDKLNPKLVITILTSLLIILLIAFIGIYFSNNNSNNELKNDSNLNSNNLDNSDNNSNIVAEVNGVPITKDEFNKRLDLLLYFQGIPDQYRDQVPKEMMLNQSIQEDLIYQEAVSNGIIITKDEAKNQLETTLINSGKDVEEFKKIFENKSFTYDDVINKFAKQLTINKYLNQTILSKISVSDEEIKNYYNNNLNQFIQPEEVRASHILVNNSDLANELIEELNNGANFSELAKEYSIGPSSVKGGDLGYFTRGKMVPEFENEAFNLSVGEYSKTPVKTQFGFHIILVTDKKNETQLGFEEVANKIREELIKEKETNEIKNYIESLFKKNNIEIFPDNLN